MCATTEAGDGSTTVAGRTQRRLSRVAVTAWALAVVGALSAPFGGFFTTGLSRPGGDGRLELVFDGWGNTGGRFGDQVSGGYVIFGIAFYAWAAVLVVALWLAVRGALDDAGASWPPASAVVTGLVGATGLATTSGVLWLSGMAWRSNTTSFRRDFVSNFAVGPGYELAMVTGGLAVAGAFASAAGWLETPDGTALPIEGPSWARLALPMGSVVVAAVLLAAPFAAYLVQELVESNDTFGAFSVDGWGELTSRSSGQTGDSHEARYGIAQAVVAALLVVGATASWFGRGRGRVHAVAQTLQLAGHAAVVALGGCLSVVGWWWLTFDEDVNPGSTMRLGFGVLLVLGTAVLSLGWIAVACWNLVEVPVMQIVRGHPSTGHRDEEDGDDKAHMHVDAHTPLDALNATSTERRSAGPDRTPAAPPSAGPAAGSGDDIVSF